MHNGKPTNGAGTGLGDIMPPSVDPMEKYFDIVRGQTMLSRRRWIVQPEWKPPAIPGAEINQLLLEEHTLPRLWQLAADLLVLAQRSGEFRVKRPNWIEPPITAEMEDLVSETAVLVGATNTDVLSYTVPDRCIVAFQSFGHALTVAAEFGNVIWNIFVNQKPIRTYQDFRLQRGTIVQPTPFPKPITLKGRDVFRVTARTAGAAVSAFARVPGFVIAPKIVTQDGSYRDWTSR